MKQMKRTSNRELRNGILRIQSSHGETFCQSPEETMAKETEWYAQYGRYSNRIKRDNVGNQYPINDTCWNRQHPDQPEWIERSLPNESQEQLRKRFYA